MIQSFADQLTEALFNATPKGRRWPPDVEKAAYRRLRQLHTVTRLADLADLTVPPGNRLEKLKGDRAGQHSMRVNQRFRICFRWKEGHAYDVELSKHYER